MQSSDIQQFQDEVWNYYHEHARHDLPWRSEKITSNFSPYAIMVSELMLQQTQVQRVIPKYLAFLEAFPHVEALAAAELGDVLRLWSGLGYNRRAKFLHQAAQKVVAEYDGVFPQDQVGLTALPGVGANTAGAIVAYAYNQPTTFIETNIRTVYIHRFFQDRSQLTDKELQAVVQAANDHEHPREWYWALMDYGAFVKKSVGNLNMLSVTYAKQSKFEGSRRQVRGQILHELKTRHLTRQVLQDIIGDERVESVLADLISENLLKISGDTYHL